MLLEEKQKFFDIYKKRHVFGEPPKSSWGLRDCPYFVVHCMALGTLGGFYGGGISPCTLTSQARIKRQGREAFRNQIEVRHLS